MHWSAIVESAGLTLVFVLGSIFEPLRKRGWAIWRSFSVCPLCVGVWVGMAVVLLRHSSQLEAPVWLTVLSHGALSGVLAYGTKLVLMWLDSH